MNDHKRVGCIVKNDGLGKPEEVRSLLGGLLVDARLYKEGQSYKELLDFVGRLPNFAPFNAMLLQVQKPGLMYAASARDWREIFGRRLKDGARPLLILWPFGPVALVYDEVDTEGKKLPEDVTSFRARYKSKDMDWKSFDLRLRRKGSSSTGLMLVMEKRVPLERLAANQRTNLPTKFSSTGTTTVPSSSLRWHTSSATYAWAISERTRNSIYHGESGKDVYRRLTPSRSLTSCRYATT